MRDLVTPSPRDFVVHLPVARSYKDLEIWQLAVAIAKQVYEVTVQLPASERFGLVTQMRRAATSLSANIAEGFCRRSQKEFRQFLGVASGSAGELESYCALCKALFNGQWPNTERLEDDLDHFQRMVNRFAQTLNRGGRKAQ